MLGGDEQIPFERDGGGEVGFGGGDVQEGFGSGVADGAFVEVDGVVVGSIGGFCIEGMGLAVGLPSEYICGCVSTICRLDGHVFPEPLLHRTTRLHVAGAEVLTALE